MRGCCARCNLDMARGTSMLTTLTRGSAGTARALFPWRVREGGGGWKKGFGVWWGWGNFPPCRTTSQHVPSANTRLTHTRRRNENKQTQLGQCTQQTTKKHLHDKRAPGAAHTTRPNQAAPFFFEFFFEFGFERRSSFFP